MAPLLTKLCSHTIRSLQKLDFSYLAVVDVINLSATLFLIGKAERELASKSFSNLVVTEADGGEGEHTDGIGIMELLNMVSRKKDFIPAITSIIIAGSFSLDSLTPKAVAHTDKQKNADILTEYGEVQNE